MSSHVPGLQSSFRFFASFLYLAKLDTSSIRGSITSGLDQCFVGRVVILFKITLE